MASISQLKTLPLKTAHAPFSLHEIRKASLCAYSNQTSGIPIIFSASPNIIFQYSTYRSKPVFPSNFLPPLISLLPSISSPRVTSKSILGLEHINKMWALAFSKTDYIWKSEKKCRNWARWAKEGCFSQRHLRSVCLLKCLSVVGPSEAWQPWCAVLWRYFRSLWAVVY